MVVAAVPRRAALVGGGGGVGAQAAPRDVAADDITPTPVQPLVNIL